MKPEQVILAERVALIVGSLGLIVTAAAVDWRIGLGLASLFLIVSTSPWRDLR
jgi:hypothetical protein